MPDGSTSPAAAVAKHTCSRTCTHLTGEQFDELALGIGRALALSDVLNTMANGGDIEALHKDTLATYSGMLFVALQDARSIIDASIASNGN